MRSHFFSIFILILAMLSIHIASSITKSLFSSINPYAATTLRHLFSGFFLLSFYPFWKIQINQKEWKRIFFYGFTLAGMTLFYYLSIEKIPIGISMAIEFIGPLSLSLIASKKLLDFLWSIFALIGILLLISHQEISLIHQHGEIQQWGIFYALLGGFFWSLYIICGQKAGKSTPPLLVTGSGMLIAGALTAPLAIWKTQAFPLRQLPVIFIVALFSGAIPFSLEMITLQRLSIRIFSMCMSLEPAVSAICAFLLLGETLNKLQTLGIGCVITALLGSSFSKNKNDCRYK